MIMKGKIMYARGFYPKGKNLNVFFRLSLLAALFLIFTTLGLWLVVRVSLMPVNAANNVEVPVTVPQNASTARIAGLLAEKGVIRSALAFRLYARVNGLDGDLKPGSYQLSSAMSVSEILQKLVKGPPDRVKITVPEGYTVEQIAGLLEEKGVTTREKFLQAVSRRWEYSFLDNAVFDRWGLDGYLYPDTYYLGTNTGAEKIVAMMLQKFEQVITEHDYARWAAARGLTLHEAVTIASMVEREARVDSERVRIAGVIFNRLRLGMPLQIDATVRYALSKPKEKLLYKDLEVDSPYNTYKTSGLPPGPIANPGWPSMQAVIEPEENDYLYYVAKPDGTHAFARTLAGHNRNIEKYRQ